MAELEKRLKTFAATIADVSPRDTILPPTQSDVGSATGRAVGELAAIALDDRPSSRLEVMGTLGEGGMGIVRLGKQVALHREVAIKELNAERQGQHRSVVKLLQEAWLAGSLEHPNIVPVYDIEVRDGGDPQIVMKRIQGEAWSELIADPEAVAERFGETDLLRWNLGVLMQVANAVRFAHDRGVVHLDLKPSNVMLGAFGEVYLVDWGLAMSLREETDGRFPKTKDVKDVIGTPTHLAPEMLTGDGSQLSERTDIYLLGSCLHEIVTGKPPHTGDSMLAIFYSAATETPLLPEDAPEELRSIAARAMALEPAERYGSADELRVAVRDFLEHQGSVALSDGAAASLAALRAAAGDEARRDEVHRAFTEARFGYRQALAAWAGNAAAADGLREAVTVMIEHELAAGTAPAAGTLLGELRELGADAAPAELAARVEAALAAHAAEGARIAKLERLGENMDLSIGRRTRLFVLGVLGLLFIAYPTWRHLQGPQPLDYAEQLTGPIIFLAAAAVLGWYGRESLGRTLVNQRLFAAIVVMFIAQMALVAAAWAEGMPKESLASMLFVLWGTSATMVTVLVERRLWPTALGQWIGLGVVTWNFELLYAGIVATNVVFVINIAVIWWPGSIRGTYDGDARVR